MSDPKVSIIIPVYNGGDYVREAIDSALGQTYEKIEVVVINDGSNDGGQTEAIAREYGNSISFYSKENGGVSSALNIGIQKMTGEYFSWLSHDDVYHKKKIEVQIKYLKEHPGTTITYSDFEIIDEMSRPIRSKRLKSVPWDQFRYSITVNSLVNGCTFLIPKICFDTCGFFDESLKVVQDYDMWFRLANSYRIDHIPEVLVKSRYHRDQGTRRLSGMVTKEGNDLVIRQLHSLSRDEIIRATGMPLYPSYLHIAGCLENRKLSRGRSLAISLAKRTGDRLSLARKFHFLWLCCFKILVARINYFSREYIVHLFRSLKYRYR